MQAGGAAPPPPQLFPPPPQAGGFLLKTEAGGGGKKKQNYMRARQVAAIAATKANLRNLATALELYALENNLNTYPPETTGTTKGINDALKDYFPGSSPKNPKNMNYKYIYEGKGASFTIYDPTNYATTSGTYLFYAVGPGGSIKELIVNTTIGQEISF